MSREDAMFEVIENLYALSHIINALQKKPHEYFNETIYTKEAHTLKLIGENEGISQAELSEKTYRTNGATSVLVSSLVERGLVHRERENSNQRRYLLTLTDLGRAINEAHAAFDEENARKASEALCYTEEDLRALSANLRKFVEYGSKVYLDPKDPAAPKQQTISRQNRFAE